MDTDPRDPVDGDADEEVSAAVGEPFALPLPLGAATGAEWRFALPAGWRLLDDTSTAAGSDEQPVDARPVVVADAPGTHRVVARLTRPWDDTVLRTVVVQATVR